jgi:hypothetical protein
VPDQDTDIEVVAIHVNSTKAGDKSVARVQPIDYVFCNPVLAAALTPRPAFGSGAAWSPPAGVIR